MTYFARPYRSCDRGTNENLNGELRRVFPKGEPLDDVEPAELTAAMDEINDRHRKILCYATAAHRFAQACEHQLE